jgi:hypothetical protein
MESDLVTQSVEQHCIVRFLVKVKSAEIVYRLNAQYEKETLLHVHVYECHHRGFAPF